uniref:Lipocalin/cytosolic fatty-acid binding domain-containing protein n=1 Tax=Bos mutus grunniens TaxID=30521 RepID=A0A8B9WRP5_BOSMU
PTHSAPPHPAPVPGGSGRGVARGEEPWAQRAGSPAALPVLGTNFRDYAIVFTQLEAQEEAFSTVELYSRTPLASQEALGRFAKWSRSLGLLSQQQAELQRDCECPRMLGRRLPA